MSNTSMGRTGNIGFRLSNLVKSNTHFDVQVFARYDDKKKNLNFNIYVLFSKFLSLLRQKVFINTNIRFIDEQVFEILFLIIVPLRWFLKINPRAELAHISGYYPKAMLYLKANNIVTLLDVAILPNSCLKTLKNEYSEAYLKSPEFLIEKKERECFKLADAIVCPSSFVYEKMVEVYPEYKNKISIVPFGISPAKLKPTKNKKYSKNILFAGALNARKGVDLLIQAFLSVGDADAKLYLCGRSIRSTKINSHKQIIQTGFVELDEFFHKSGIFILPTFMEGSAKVIYEAMCAGLAVITTAEAGSIIKNGYNGIIVPSGDAGALAIEISKLLSDEKLQRRLGECAISSVKQYTWARYAESVYSIYQDKLKIV